MTGEKDPRDVMQAEHDARLSEHPAFRAPAEMPGVEEIARAICIGNPDDCVFGAAGTHEPMVCHKRRWQEHAGQARAVLALFAPILAEKERLEAANAKRKEFGKWLDDLAKNPPPPSEALKKLLADYKASGIKSVGLDSPFNACCYRDQCKALEARALAAEAALAAAVQALEPFADEKNGVMQDILWGDHPDSATMTITCPLGQVRKAREVVRAAAIRAEGSR